MKTVVLHDTTRGNTKAIAEASAEGLENARTVPVTQSGPKVVSPGDLLVVGCPINGWRPTPAVTEALVNGTEVPLLNGETTRALSWGREHLTTVKAHGFRKSTS